MLRDEEDDDRGDVIKEQNIDFIGSMSREKWEWGEKKKNGEV